MHRIAKTATAAALALLLPGTAPAAEILVFAAASLKEALDEAAADWTAEAGVDVVISLAGSSTLARQIQAGAPADVFVSANRAWIDVLERDGHLLAGSRRDLLTNSLVVVAHDPDASRLDFASSAGLAGQLGDGRLAMALVDAVPAGIYGKAALQSLGWWPEVAPRVAQVDNVRAALALVATGEAPLGIVYASDATAEPRVTVIGTFPAHSHPPIVYPAVATATADPDRALAFLDYLSGPVAAAVFRGHGFGIAGAGE